MKRRDDPALRGLLLVDKPLEWTSHDVVGWVRRHLGLRRVGHGGTLDPLATGLLPCFVGPATRLVDHFHGWSKTYVGVIALGEETETGDAESRRAAAPPPPTPPAPVLRAARDRLVGSYEQRPPVYSAKKIGGVRAHELARKGAAPVLPAVPVTVHALRLKPAGPGRLAFATRVSSGTYIRSLARDLGRIVGTGAHLESLRRRTIGPLTVRGAVVPGDGPDPALLRAALLPAEAIPLPLPDATLDADGTRAFLSGQSPLGAGVPQGALGSRLRVLDPSGCLLGIGQLEEGGRIQPRTVLAPPPSPA